MEKYQLELFEEVVKNNLHEHDLNDVLHANEAYEIILKTMEDMNLEICSKDAPNTDKISLHFMIETFSEIYDEEIERDRNLARAENIFKFFLNMNLLDKNKIIMDHEFMTDEKIKEVYSKSSAMAWPD